jgi:GMP synthase-like glutamine amidotransferase
MRRALALVDEDDAAGWIGERARQHGICVVPVRRSAAGSPPPLAGFDLVLSFGSEWSVTQAGQISWIGDELRLVGQAWEAGVPVLGICFGGQLLAKALGGAVRRAPRPEIGWVGAGSRDRRVVPDGPWFTWHYDHFELPPRAELLAANGTSPQAFGVGRSLGVQFHPEVTQQLISRWCEAGRERLVRAGVDPDATIERSAANIGTARTAAHSLFDAFMTRAGLRGLASLA